MGALGDMEHLYPNLEGSVLCASYTLARYQTHSKKKAHKYRQHNTSGQQCLIGQWVKGTWDPSPFHG